MSSIESKIMTSSVVVFGLCALVMTGVFVRRELAGGKLKVTRRVANWSSIVQGHVVGDSAGDHVVVIFADFQCPACKAYESVVAELLRRHTTGLKLVYRHFPLQAIHPQAEMAANAFECAADQGRAEEMHVTLYVSQDSLGDIGWAALAHRAGVTDTNRFKSCISERQFKARIDADLLLAKQLELPGTPSVIADGVLYTGAGMPSVPVLEKQMHIQVVP